MRLTTPAQKAIAVAVLVAVDVALVFLFDAFHSELGSIALTVLQTAGWYLATRVFRGPGEPLDTARPWWRMTNRPLLSAVFGALYGVSAIANALTSIAGSGSVSGWVSTLGQTVLAVLFLTSAVRLRVLARVPA
jgi:hypothetical protein